MKTQLETKLFSCIAVATALALVGCTAMTTLPSNKLSEAAAAVTGKTIVTVGNVRSIGDKEYFDAQSADGKAYACSLSMIMGMTYQHQKCDAK
jgi:hypothetical protein